MQPKPKSRWKIILSAWPWQGALFIAASFAFSIWWLWVGLAGSPTQDPANWLEPLASILGGIGAFVLAAILIFKRVDSARTETESYQLARGLAAGYYFNFVRPLVRAIRDRQHPIHAEVARFGDYQIGGVLVGIPATLAEFDPERHVELFQSLGNNNAAGFEWQELKVTIKGRPRPLFARLALHRQRKIAVVVDIPTTLTVIADFAEFFATHGPDASDDEFVSQARKETVAANETAEFSARLKQTLEEFQVVISKVGSMEPPGTSAAALVHIVALPQLKHRLNEIAGA